MAKITSNEYVKVAWVLDANMTPAQAAAPTATIPADGGSAAVFLIEPNSTRTFAFPYGIQIAAIAPLVGSDLYVSIGDGVAL